MRACLVLPCAAVSCFLHVYLGLSEVLGGLPASLKGCAREENSDIRVGELRALLWARVQDMLTRAERGRASLGDMNECAVLHACMHDLECLMPGNGA